MSAVEKLNDKPMSRLDAGSLVRAGRDFQLPFSLVVTKGMDGDMSEIKITRILRVLPGRRVAAVAENRGEVFFVKVFVGPSARNYWRREVDGVIAIQAAGVPTPEILWQGKLKGDGYVLASQWVPGAASLAGRWDSSDGALREKVMALLARLHAAGVVQNDIHPENFLVRGDQIFMVDGGGIVRQRKPGLARKKSLKNLALFVAQFRDVDKDAVRLALRSYCKHRGWESGDGTGDELHRYIVAASDLCKREFVGKAFRECTRFSCIRRFRRFQVIERRYCTPAMMGLLGRLDTAMAEGKVIKDGNTVTLVRVESPFGALAVKRYNMKNPLHRLLRAPRRSRAWKSWANSYRLEFLGISTLRPVALVEDRFGPLRGKAWFITRYEEVVDATHLPRLRQPEEVMETMVAILKGLHAAGITHGDLKASNFLLGEGGVKLADLDSMVDHSDACRFESAFSKDLERFMKNWGEIPALRDGFSRLIRLRIPGAA